MATIPHTPPHPDSATSPPLSFEGALSELEAIVAAMEAGRMPLQEALEAYKRGVELLRQCQTTLTDAERQIRILENGELHEFDAASEPATDAGKGGESQEG